MNLRPKVGGGPRTRFLPFVCLVAAIALSIPAAAQNAASDVVAFRDRLFDVQFITGTTVIGVGYPGLVIRSEDAGASWTRIKVPAADALFSVDFPDPNNGWIVGRNGLILRSKDGGVTWTKQNSGTTEPLFAVDFLDSKRGTAVGYFGTTVRTTDGGASWKLSVIEIMFNASLNAVAMIDGITIFAAGDYPGWELELADNVTPEMISNVYRSDDGGATWAVVPTGSEAILFDLEFTADGKTGVAAGATGRILRTDDGGATWTERATVKDNHLAGIYLRGGEVWAVGLDGVILRVAKDRAQEMNSGVYIWLSAVAFGADGAGVIVGGRGTVLTSTDGGTSWK